MSDDPIDVSGELAAAQARLPVTLPDRGDTPLDITIRMLALTIAQRHVGDTVIREGNMYQQLKMDNKPIEKISVNHVVHYALVFERYLWGEWSKGVAENAINSALTEAADVLEKEIGKGKASRSKPATKP